MQVARRFRGMIGMGLRPPRDHSEPQINADERGQALGASQPVPMVGNPSLIDG